jgi:hypothetical protein
MSFHTIANYTNNYSEAIVNNLEPESIAVYKYLKSEFHRTKVAENLIFQFLYRSFYRLNNAGLSPHFKTEYFKILEEENGRDAHDIATILRKLYGFKNRKDQSSLQFSFATKLLNTVDNDLPIYDSEVARVFGYVRPYQTNIEAKLAAYLNQLQHITGAYKTILKEGLIEPALACFDLKFKEHGLPDMKRMDFLFWSAGKLMKRSPVGELV